MQIFSTPEIVHNVVIRIYKNSYRGGETIKTIVWNDLRWEIRIKYEWYFRYRAALLQVQFPKNAVDIEYYITPAQGRKLEEILAAKKRAKKAKITEFKNKLEKYKKQWNSLFPIDDDKAYIAAISKIKRLEIELEKI